MHLTGSDLMALRDAAVQAVKQAADYIQQFVSASKIDGTTLKVINKATGSSRAASVVTEVDYHCDALIRQCLAASIRQYDLAILTEETADDLQRFNKDYFWCVDPLDGTLAFTEGRSGYAVSVALVSRGGQPIIGAVANAVDGTYYSAILGQGLWKNTDSWQPSTNADSSVLTIACDNSFIEANTGLAMLQAFANQQGFATLKLLEPAGAVMNALYVLLHQPALYLKLPKPTDGGGSTWDFSATALLLAEASASVSDAYGKPLSLNNRSTTFMNHCGILFSSDKKLAQDLVQYLEAQRFVQL